MHPRAEQRPPIRTPTDRANHPEPPWAIPPQTWLRQQRCQRREPPRRLRHRRPQKHGRLAAVDRMCMRRCSLDPSSDRQFEHLQTVLLRQSFHRSLLTWRIAADVTPCAFEGSGEGARRRRCARRRVSEFNLNELPYSSNEGHCGGEIRKGVVPSSCEVRPTSEVGVN